MDIHIKHQQNLAVPTNEEAFMATKMAVYTSLYDYQMSDFEGIGDAGYRVINAINNIVSAARNSSSTKISSDLKLTSDSNLFEFKII